MEKQKFDDILSECEKSNNVEFVRSCAQEVALSGNPYFICDFVENVSLADTPEVMPILQMAIEKTGDVVHIYEFAFLTADCGYVYVDYKQLQEVIESYKNPKLLCYSAEFVPTFEKKSIGIALAECGNKRWLEHYIQNGLYNEIEDEGERAEVERLVTEKYKSVADSEKIMVPKGLEEVFAEDDVDKIVAKAIQSADPYTINEVAELLNAYLEEEQLWELQQAIQNTGDILHIYEFGASVERARITEVEKSAVQSGMAKYMYYVGAYVPNADQLKMLDAIKITKNKKYIKMMEDHIAEEL